MRSFLPFTFLHNEGFYWRSPSDSASTPPSRVVIAITAQRILLFCLNTYTIFAPIKTQMQLSFYKYRIFVIWTSMKYLTRTNTTCLKHSNIMTASAFSDQSGVSSARFLVRGRWVFFLIRIIILYVSKILETSSLTSISLSSYQLIQNQQPGKLDPSIEHMLDLFRDNQVTERRFCRPQDHYKYFAQTYLTYLRSSRIQEELTNKYFNKGERSIKDSARLVGLELPKQNH